MLFNSKGKRNLGVAVSIAAQDEMKSMTAYDLSMLTGFMGARHPEIRTVVNIAKGTLLPEQRHAMVREALAVEGLTHIMWIDSDMRFPKDVVVKLLAHEKAIVGCNYPTRRHPIIPTAAGPDNTLLYSGHEDTVLVPVQRLGMGALLVDLDVYRTIEAPWFALGFSKDHDSYGGEDVFFCAMARKHGYEILVDPALSWQIKHCGEFEYSLVHAEATLRHALQHEGAVTPQIVIEGQ